MNKNVNYYGIHRRKESKNNSGYINAKALGWSDNMWRFSTYKRAQEDYINASKKIGKFKTLYN